MNANGHVILKNCHSEFIKPVKEDLRAVCLPVSQELSQNFLRTYEGKGKARLTLVSEVRLADGTVACRMTGEFVGVPV
jgi:thioesterase domain-containing protein